MMRVDLGAWALLLIAMAIAYFVCLKASKEGAKLFKYGGYAIGIIMLVISLILAITDVGSRMARRRRPVARKKPAAARTAPKISRRTAEIEARKKAAALRRAPKVSREIPVTIRQK
ncbi:MAG: hypothetical protein U9R52_04785 [Candidatus Omnitrophota bacterium]|nr:hypothetical protein [Candidatus Omnitrophota bacterium]